MKLQIDLTPVTKKNSQRIIKVKGYPRIIPSKKYADYEKKAINLLKDQWQGETITEPVNVKAIFYMPTRRIIDLVNLQEALLDVLVRAGILGDDNSRIVESMDGSRVAYDKEHPRTEIVIRKASRAEIALEVMDDEQ